MEDNKVYKCTLFGGCNFQSDQNTCQLEGSLCAYRKEEKSKNDLEKKSEKWFEKYYK